MTLSANKAEVEVRSLFGKGIKNATASFTGSKTFMKILTSVALSGLTYHRKLFPEDSFIVYPIQGRVVPLLKEISNCDEANIFHKLVVSLRDALDKGYLKAIMLNVYGDENDPSTLIESFAYNFEYNPDENHKKTGKDGSKRHDSNYILQRVFNLLEVTKSTCEEMSSLPDKWGMALYLNYTDTAPDDFTSPFFDPCDSLHLIDKEFKIQIGRVTTPFHQLRVFSYSDVPLTNGNCIARPTQTSKIKENIRDSPSKCSKNIMKDIYMNKMSQETVKDLFENKSYSPEKDRVNSKNEKVNKKKVNNQDFKRGSTESNTDVSQSICCPCQRNFRSYLATNIKCSSCSKEQHAECFGILLECMPPGFVHICDECAKSNDELLCSDPEMINRSVSEKKIICLLRSTLISFHYYKDVDIPLVMSIQSVTEKIANTIFKRLDDLEIFHVRNLTMSKGNKTRQVDLNALTNVFPKYFPHVVKQDSGPSMGLEKLHLNLENRETSTPNILNQSIDYSPSRIQEVYSQQKTTQEILKEKLLDTSMESIASRRSTRIKNGIKRYVEEDDDLEPPTPKKKFRGVRKILKKNS